MAKSQISVNFTRCRTVTTPRPPRSIGVAIHGLSHVIAMTSRNGVDTVDSKSIIKPLSRMKGNYGKCLHCLHALHDLAGNPSNGTRTTR
jgi:hypothetical protein